MWRCFERLERVILDYRKFNMTNQKNATKIPIEIEEPLAKSDQYQYLGNCPPTPP